MMGHTFKEGMALLKRRWLISLSLALALSVPLALAALSASVARWSWPLVHRSAEEIAVPVLLHPKMEGEQRKSWIEKQAKDHPDWKISEVGPDVLARRLVLWFPYLEDFFGGEDGAELPPLVEIRAPIPDEIRSLDNSPAIIAVGPTHSVHRILGKMAEKIGLLMATISAILLFVGVLMAGTWTHLEIYRHADEISIMRLVGATESAIRGPLVIALLIPGFLAGLLACGGSLILIRQVNAAISGLGLGEAEMTIPMALVLMLLGPVIPGLAAILTLARHARNDE